MNLPQLIITIVVGALMVLAGFYYGGPLLNEGSIGAQANTVTNAGNNIALGLQAYRADNPTAALPTVEALTPDYLRSVPQLDGIVKDGGAIALDGTLGIVAPIANKSICDRINNNLNVASAATLTASNVAAPSLGTACFKSSAAVGTIADLGDFVYFLKS